MDQTGRRRNETIQLSRDLYVCRFSGVTLDAPIAGGTIEFVVNERPWAVVIADLTEFPRVDVELSSVVTIHQLLDTCERLVFTGSVKRVTHAGPSVHIRLEMGQQLVESGSTLVAHRNCEIELVRSITAAFGVTYTPWGQTEPLATEEKAIFEVICPVAGVDVSSPSQFDQVLFEPTNPTVDRLVTLLQISVDFQQWLRNFPAVAKIEVSSLYMHDAQEEGVRRIDEVLGKLVTISRYSLLTNPRGTHLSWRRENKFFNPQRGQVAIVIDDSATRAWIQRLEVPPDSHSLDLGSSPLSDYRSESAQLPPLRERQAMVFLARAARRAATIDRVIFLWQSIEFFLGDYKTPKLYDNPAKKKVREARDQLSKALNEAQIARLEEVHGTLNSPSMRMKLDHYINSTGVPLSATEYQLLWDLRAYRNGVIHGRDADTPTQEAVDHGVAVTARIFLWPNETAYPLPGPT